MMALDGDDDRDDDRGTAQNNRNGLPVIAPIMIAPSKYGIPTNSSHRLGSFGGGSESSDESGISISTHYIAAGVAPCHSPTTQSHVPAPPIDRLKYNQSRRKRNRYRYRHTHRGQ
jgi:hypothetical protein